MYARTDRNKVRTKKHMRIRNRVKGTTDRPRLSVYRSLAHIYVQIIDDTKGVTLVSASTTEEALNNVKYGGNREAAKQVGKLIGQRAIEKGIKQVVFDRGGYIYHGRVKDLADAARECGLDF